MRKKNVLNCEWFCEEYKREDNRNSLATRSDRDGDQRAKMFNHLQNNVNANVADKVAHKRVAKGFSRILLCR